jgi:hypothetical protein
MKYVGGSYLHQEILFTIWILFTFIYYTNAIWTGRKKYSWLIIFALLKQLNHGSILDANQTESDLNESKLNSLKKLHKIVNILVNSLVIPITLGGFVVFSAASLKNYGLFDLILFGTTWTVIWTIWVYYICCIIYWPLGYFFLVCIYCNMKIKVINQRLVAVGKVSKGTHLMKERRLRRLLKDILKLWSMIDEYNDYWNVVLTLNVMLAVSVIWFIAYLLFIGVINLEASVVYYIVVIGHINLLTISTLTASSLNNYSSKTYKLLEKINHINFPFSTKLKVNKMS